MKYFLLILCLISSQTFAQKTDNVITLAEVDRIARTLAADDMQGRAAFTPGIDKAADFIAAEFGKNGLAHFKKDTSYFQHFSLTKPESSMVSGTLGRTALANTNVIAITQSPSLDIRNFYGYEVVKVQKTDTLFPVLRKHFDDGKDMIFLVDSSHLNAFNSFRRFSQRAEFPSKFSQILMLTGDVNEKNISLQVQTKFSTQVLKNVLAVVPGKSKKDEYVVFGAHYDHIGIGRPDKNMDSIFNGANDNATGTTAMILLSKYFKELNTNERTLVFVGFTAEEMGGFGSRYFATQLDPEKVVAMINIEMIGTQSRWGANTAYITGYEKTDMGEIMQRNLKGSKFKFEPDPYPKQELFYRSDNATLARLGVPAHTISTAKMEEPPNDEPNYHKASDEIETLDLPNMTEIIKAIALSSSSIVTGKDSPTRVEIAN